MIGLQELLVVFLNNSTGQTRVRIPERRGRKDFADGPENEVSGKANLYSSYAGTKKHAWIRFFRYFLRETFATSAFNVP